MPLGLLGKKLGSTRVYNDAGVLVWIKWDETTNAISLRDPKTGQFSGSEQPGYAGKLKAGNVVLDLRRSSVVGLSSSSAITWAKARPIRSARAASMSEPYSPRMS